MLSWENLQLSWGAMARRSSRSRLAILSAALLLLSSAWLTLVFSIGRCCPAPGNLEGFPHSRIASNSSSTITSGRSSHLASSSVTPGKLSLSSIVFGIAGSSELWPRRKEFVRLWWRANRMRGFVWLDKPVDSWDEELPPIKVSENTHRFRDGGHPTGVRISRIVLETFNMNLPGVEWFVLCDDDTLFNVENLVSVLAKYDSSQLFYIGSTSESHQQNVAFSYDMAFGGGGFALSFPLAKALAGMQDECLQHYPELIGSDDRLRACISELGVPLTREVGFHQCDVRGNAMGLLAAHPVAPFVSLHHLEVMEPLFPTMDTLQGLQTLSRAMQVDSTGFLQQAICYDQNKALTFSISAGYLVQVFPEIVYPKVLEKAELTFMAWNRKHQLREFDLDVRTPFWICQQPFLFYLDEISEEGGKLLTSFKRSTSLDRTKMLCWSGAPMPQRIRVVAQPLSSDWYKAPRRQCCEIGEWKDGEDVQVSVGGCTLGQSVVQAS